jgi:hypothetical protein
VPLRIGKSATTLPSILREAFESAICFVPIKIYLS